jgi:hypothetical protein
MTEKAQALLQAGGQPGCSFLKPELPLTRLSLTKTLQTTGRMLQSATPCGLRYSR